MLEVEQAGEVALMKELTALRGSRCLRDPSTAASWKSPVSWAVASPNAAWKSPSSEAPSYAGVKQEQFDERGGYAADDFTKGDASEVFVQADSVSCNDSRFCRGRCIGEEEEAYYGLDHEEFRSCKEGARAVLHNWRTSLSVDVEDAPLVDADGVSFWASRQYGQNKHSRNTNGVYFREKDDIIEDRRRRPLRKVGGDTIESSRRVASSQQGGQLLSPLILNSLEDAQNLGRSMSLFRLEEPGYADAHCLNQEADTDLVAVHRKAASRNFGYRSPPGFETAAAASNERQSINANIEHWQELRSPGRNFQATGSIRGAREANSMQFGDDMKVSEQLNDYGAPYYGCRKQKQHRGSPLNSAQRGLACEFQEVARNKVANVSENHTLSPLEPEYVSDTYTFQKLVPRLKSGRNALPLCTNSETSSGISGRASFSVEAGCNLRSGYLDGELELEAISKSNCSRDEGFADDRAGHRLVLSKGRHIAAYKERPRNLSQKYRPKVFEELVGQNIVAQALANAISKWKIAPVYLFQGSRGTGKTSAARIFAAALNCIASGEKSPCGICTECLSFALGKSSYVKEVDAASNNGIERVKALLEDMISAPSLSRFKVFIIDECHMLTNETWNALLKHMEEPPLNIVFILITTDPDQLPRTAVSRCQRFPFPKIKDSDIVRRLHMLASLEKLEIEPKTLDLIASISDGSLRDAETILDQLSLLESKISSSTVHELVGSASKERLLGLLDTALLGDTVNTVVKAKELMNSGVEPLALMSQLATLITDILAGLDDFTEKKRKGSFPEHAGPDGEHERLQIALRILSEADKQLRNCHDRKTWLIAALLQFGPDSSSVFPRASQGTRTTQSSISVHAADANELLGSEVNVSSQPWHKHMGNDEHLHLDSLSTVKLQDNIKGNNSYTPNKNSSCQIYNCTLTEGKLMPMANIDSKIHLADQSRIGNVVVREPSKFVERQRDNELPLEYPLEAIEQDQSGLSYVSDKKLVDLWDKVLEGCQPLPLQNLLQAHCKLLALSTSKVDVVAHLEFRHPEYKARCERSKKRIIDAFQSVLGFPVKVEMILASLPSGKNSSFRPQILSKQPGNKQGCLKKNLIATVESRLQFKNGILQSRRIEGRFTENNASDNMDSSECFAGVPQFYGATVLREGQHTGAMGLGTISSNQSDHDLSDSNSVEKCSQEVEDRFVGKEQLESACSQEERSCPPLSTLEHGVLMDTAELQNEAVHGARSDQSEGIRQDTHVTKCNDGEKLECSPLFSNEGKCQGETLEATIYNSHGISTLNAPIKENWQRGSIIKDHLDSDDSCIFLESSSSCSDSLERSESAPFKVIRWFRMNRRIKSLPSSDGDSQNGKKGASAKKSLNTKSVTSQKPRRSFHSLDNLKVAENTMDVIPMVSQKKGRILEAAESVTRFFQQKFTGAN